MSIKPYLRKTWNAACKLLNVGLSRIDHKIMATELLYEWQISPESLPSYSLSKLPEGAADYLHAENPKLLDLQIKYAHFDKQVTTPLVWTDARVRPEDILYFRGDNAYVYQLRGPNMNIMAYALTSMYVKSIDSLGLMARLIEDNYFGNYTFTIDNKCVSRDLLDSIMEIYFLEKHLNLSHLNDFSVLDIGAGYGRLAHRMVTALPNIQTYLCTDAVAISSFISDYYLRFRGTTEKTQIVPLHNIESTLKQQSVKLAINIHSFSECTISAIDWWLSLLQKQAVKYLMIVPNAGNHGGEQLLTHDGQDFGVIIESHGYKLIAKEPKYSDQLIQKFAINPTHYYLFELQ